MPHWQVTSQEALIFVQISFMRVVGFRVLSWVMTCWLQKSMAAWPQADNLRLLGVPRWRKSLMTSVAHAHDHANNAVSTTLQQFYPSYVNGKMAGVAPNTIFPCVIITYMASLPWNSSLALVKPQEVMPKNLRGSCRSHHVHGSDQDPIPQSKPRTKRQPN